MSGLVVKDQDELYVFFAAGGAVGMIVMIWVEWVFPTRIT